MHIQPFHSYMSPHSCHKHTRTAQWPIPWSKCFCSHKLSKHFCLWRPVSVFFAFAWYLASLKSNTLTTDLYFRGTETEWERNREWVCVCIWFWCVLVCISRLCALLQKSGMFHCRICFLPIKQALISVTIPELRGSRVPGCYLRSVQSKLLHKKVDCCTSDIMQPEHPNSCRWSSTDVAIFAKSAAGKLSTQRCQSCCFSSLSCLVELAFFSLLRCLVFSECGADNEEGVLPFGPNVHVLLLHCLIQSYFIELLYIMFV